MKNVKNFARFYALFRQIPDADKELRESYVQTFTNGRETSLTGMHDHEYRQLCDHLQAAIGGKPVSDYRQELKKARSAFLFRLSKIGVNTTDWGQVDEFCLRTRNIGKRFCQLSIQELKNLIPVLEAIRKKKKQTRSDISMSPQAADRLIQFMANQIPN